MKLCDLFEEPEMSMHKALMDMFGLSHEAAIVGVNIMQDYDGKALADAIWHGDRRGLAQLYTDAKAAIAEEVDLDEGIAWARSGNKVVKKFRCTGGPRNGRVVSKPAQCFAPPDIKKRMKLKQTKAKMGKKMARKRKKTMRTNAASKRVQALNKSKRK